MPTSIDAQIRLLITGIGTQIKGVKTQISNLPVINDITASTTSLYSSSRVEARIQAKIDALVNGAGTALDTLKELQDALGGDANFSTTVLAALAKRLRVDAAQTFTSGEQAQGRTNLDVWSKAEVGPIDTDYVALLNTAVT